MTRLRNSRLLNQPGETSSSQYQHVEASEFGFCMKLSFLILLALALLANGCAPPAQTPEGKAKSYPPAVQPSPERQEQAEREWRRLLELQSLPSSPPDLDPVTLTPRSLGNVQGIKLATTPPQPGTETVAIREAARRFIDRWRDLLRADPQAVSLAKNDTSNGTHRLTFKQADYPFPVAGGYGEMTMVIGNDGMLRQLEDRFIPLVEVPFKPTLPRETAAERVTDRVFRYGDIAGREQQVKVTANEVRVKGLVILPVEKGNRLDVYLAWEVAAGSSMTWTVYIDAVEGVELKVVQNFNT